MATECPLHDRVVILTGASSGLGVHLADALDRAGAKLVLVARRASLLERVADGKRACVVAAADITDVDGRSSVVETAISSFGSVYGLVNNAGVNHVVPAVREELDDFRRVLDVNLVAPFALSQLVAPIMRQAGSGSIVNITSTAATHSSSYSPEASYIAAKAGLAGLTRELASQWARYSIRVNAVAPGAFVTEMVSESFMDSEPGKALLQSIPMGRPGTAGELAASVTFLLDPSNTYLTGQSIVLDGGLTLSAC